MTGNSFKTIPNIKAQFSKYFKQAIVDVNSLEKADKLLNGVIKPEEVEEIIMRLAVAYWIKKGRDEQNIIRNLGVDKVFIKQVRRMMLNEGFDYTIKLIEAEEFANVWSKKIKKYYKRSGIA